MADEPKTNPATRSSQFAAVDCPLCPHPDLWDGAPACPVCLGGKRISRFKLPGIYAMYPDLSRKDTDPEMQAVRTDEDGGRKT
jgi:hypothetical protein